MKHSHIITVKCQNPNLSLSADEMWQSNCARAGDAIFVISPFVYII